MTTLDVLEITLVLLAALDWVVVLLMVQIGREERILGEGAYQFRILASSFLSLCATAGATLAINRATPFLPNAAALGLLVFIVIGVSVPVVVWPLFYERGWFR